MPKYFDAPVLNQLANIEEIEIETHSARGRMHRTIIWVMVDDQDVLSFKVIPGAFLSDNLLILA